jgi:hypothetical protein
MDKPIVEPKVYMLNDIVSGIDALVPGAHIIRNRI